MNILKRMIFIAVFILTGTANAALIDMGNYVTDDVAGIDYLKGHNTVGYSWDDVVTNDTLGYIAGGWTVASQAALYALDDTQPISFILIRTCDCPFLFTNNDERGGQSLLPSHAFIDAWPGPLGYSRAWGIEATNIQSDFAFVALSRTSIVPLPAAAWLFGSALLGLGVIKRKKS